MKKEVRIKVYNKYDGHCAYCGKAIKYEDMQVDHLVAKNRGGYARYDEETGKSVVVHGENALSNYMPACRACNFRKGTMRLEEFRAAIKQQAEGLLSGAAKFQMRMSLAYGLVEDHFDNPVVFYFEKFNSNE